GPVHAGPSPGGPRRDPHGLPAHLPRGLGTRGRGGGRGLSPARGRLSTGYGRRTPRGGAVPLAPSTTAPHRPAAPAAPPGPPPPGGMRRITTHTRRGLRHGALAVPSRRIADDQRDHPVTARQYRFDP